MQVLKNLPMVLMAALLVTVSGGVMAGQGTQAAFTDVATASATFTAGTVDIALANANIDCDDAGNTYLDSNGTSVATLFSTTLAKPGTFSTGFLCIKNEGSLPLQWGLASVVSNGTTVTGDLKGDMKARIWSLTSAASTDTTACIDGFTAAGGDVTLTGGVQAGLANELYTSALLSTNPSITAGATTLMSAGAFMKVCVSVVLPTTVTDSDPDATTTKQGQVVTGAFTITGNQT